MAVSPNQLLPKSTSQAKLQKKIQLQFFIGSKVVSTYTFLINPQNYQQTEAGRVQVLQTLGGGFADIWGPALVQITFSGTTGLRRLYVNGIDTDGYERFQTLLGAIRAMWRDPVQAKSQDWHFFLWNWTDDQFYEVIPLQNSWTQAVPESLIFRYQLSFIALREASRPATTASYAVRAWFSGTPYYTGVPGESIASGAVKIVQSLVRVSAMLPGSAVPPSWAVAQVMQAEPTGSPSLATLGYIPYLAPQDLPTEEFYPGISSVASGMVSLASGTLFPMMETITQGGDLPLPVAYGRVQKAAQDALSLLQQLEALGSVPTILDAEWGDVVDELQGFLLFPEAFMP